MWVKLIFSIVFAFLGISEIVIVDRTLKRKPRDKYEYVEWRSDILFLVELIFTHGFCFGLLLSRVLCIVFER